MGPRWPARVHPGLLAGVLFLAAGCVGSGSALRPAGPGAARIAAHAGLLLGVTTVVLALVVVTLAWAARPRRAGPPRSRAPETLPRLGMIAGGILLPLALLSVLAVGSVRTLAALGASAPASLRIEVTAHQWWWELRYLTGAGEPVVTANELHIPVGQRVEIRLLAADVIHSFWVPALHGKLDLVPGRTNVTWLQADRPGVYRGQCAEYCGLQHAGMGLIVVAMPGPEFEGWLTAQRRPAVPVAGAEPAQALFLTHCAECHTVRGTQAFFGRLGPDLTHVASRTTLAAGMLTNVKGHLAGWIADPQGLKPGARMPRVPLAGDDLHAIVEYVAALR